jgi:KDEL-tailed cysteine endopeptidase
MMIHGKTYRHSEYHDRFSKFVSNLQLVQHHNADMDLGRHTHFLAVNRFADLSHEEFKKQTTGFRAANPKDLRAKRYVTTLNGTAPESVDWRAQGAVTGIKDQGQCGSCWAFSTTGAVEGSNFLKTGRLQSFSEQMLVDCDDNGDQGCDGGLMDNAFGFIEQNGGIDTENDYPYLAHGSASGCSASREAKHVGTVSGFTDVPTNDEGQLMLAVAKQPVAVAIDANPLQFYDSGVLSDPCGTDLDHGVLVVGYSTDSSDPTNPDKNYWIVKNSWGESWGEDGFFRLAMGKQGTSGECGITLSASYPQA